MYARSELIRFQHCDPAGIVFYPRYVEMINAIVEDWFSEHVGVSFAALHEKAAIPVVTLNIEFQSPSRIGERLEFQLEPLRVGRTSLELKISAQHDGKKRLTCNLKLVHISKEDYRPREWPPDLRSKFGL